MQQLRRYPGESAAGPLIDWLNTQASADAKCRVGVIIDRLVQLSQARAVVSMEHDSLVATALDALAVAVWGEISRDHKETDSKPLENRVRARWSQLGERYKKTWFYATVQNYNTYAVISDAIDRGEDIELEVTVFDCLSSVSDFGMLDRLLRCRCHLFFFRRFRHQLCCSEACRLAHFRASEDVRLKRNERSRDLYRLHKSGKVR